MDNPSNTRSPHGALNTPCQNCHTIQGWKPIRNRPEFDHNQTRYPLRGLHEGVNCTQCHTKLVFTNVGNKCADCHADIHKRQFGASCEQCHTVRGWNVSIQQIRQHENRFPLIGAHAALDCESCHKGAATGQFIGLSTQCYSCHAKDFQGAKNPSHVASGFATTCQDCHSLDSWLGAKFDHLKFTGFALTGAHATLDCAACHIGGKFTGTPATCVGCHLSDFQKTANPNHAAQGFSQTCQQCHNTTSWLQVTFDHSLTKFPLTGTHSTTACAACHINNNYNLSTSDCYSCHVNNYNGTTNPNHVQAHMPQTCQNCHNTTNWNNATFDHSTTGFPLTGTHIKTPCTQCHINGNYNITDISCFSCHSKEYQGTTNPNHVQAGLPNTCQQCHNTTDWGSASFDHSTTGFTLTGTHINTPCASCHINGNYALTSANTACFGCHQKDYNGTTSPNHVQAKLAQTCQDCHNTTNWGSGSFDHSTTGFPLTGTHINTPCASCHVNGNYALKNTACNACHLKDYQGTANPNHVQAGIPQTCQNCHNTTDWGSASFDHSTTGFPLTGTHVKTACAACHVNGNYALTSANTACYSCHSQDYKGTTDPNHVQAKLAQTCQDCHNTTDWGGASFNHATTGFPLTGAHVSTACTLCHVNGNYALTSANTACYGCHQADYTGTTSPNHVQAKFAQTCQDCHSTTNWGSGSFNHATTGFALTGTHLTTPCTLCHVNSNYNLTAANTACYACHSKDYQGTTNPNHVQANFPQSCQQCHNTTNWGGANFDHSTTGFPLTGTHASTPCTQCHVNGNYTLTVTTCVSCHLKDFQGTTDPNHVQANFPQTCQQCHNTTNWGGTTFNHATTGFALTGTHVTTPCIQCHVNGNYALTNAACNACHLKDYQGTTDPNHVQANFPQTCAQCHSTTNWLGAVFNHASTGFALTGAHTNTPCASCHVNGNYSLTTGACSSCHLKDYNTTTDPNHAKAGFPTTCDTCHSTTNWSGAVFDHSKTAFPLTGAHAPLDCNQCHSSGVYKGLATTCVSCHLANYNGTTNPNHAKVGYPQTCEVCHNTSDWTQSTFNHNNTTFPLTGAHTTVLCASCHVNNNYTTLSTDCYGCHKADYQGTTNPNHTAAGFPTTCLTCHTTAAWTGATFNHTYFPVNHGNANGVCATCHTNPNDYSVFQCTNCHSKSSTDPKHQGVGGYVYNSINCYQCHRNGNGG